MNIAETVARVGIGIEYGICPHAIEAARERLKAFPALYRSYPQQEGMYKTLVLCAIKQMRSALFYLMQNPDYVPFITACLKEQSIPFAKERAFFEGLAVYLYGVAAFDGVIAWQEDMIVLMINEQTKNL